MFSCDRCGQEWETHPFLAVPCPRCHAGVGIWCSANRPSGHRVKFGTKLHVEREQAALDAGVIARCPAADQQDEPSIGPLFGG